MSQAEPQKLSSIFLEVANSALNPSVNMDVLCVEVATGNPSPVIPPLPDERLSSVYVEQAVSAEKFSINMDYFALETACNTITENFNIYDLSIEVATGEIVPVDLTPYFRCTTLLQEMAVSFDGLNTHYSLDAMAIEVALREILYSPEVRVFLLY